MERATPMAKSGGRVVARLELEVGRLVSGDGGLGDNPGRCAGHWVALEEGMRAMPAASKAALVSSTEPGRLTERQASSMTIVSKARLWPSMAE